MIKGDYWEIEAKQSRDLLLQLTEKNEKMMSDIVKLEFLHKKTADRLGVERMKRRHAEGRNKILQMDVDGLEEKIQKSYETSRDDHQWISQLVDENQSLHSENAELKNDIVHLIRQSRKES